MKKIPTIFQRNYDGDFLVRDAVTPGCEWVFAGEGIATRKYDGTCCMIRDGKLYKRYELRPGRTAPKEFEPADDVDATTGKQPGWVPVTKADVWHCDAWGALASRDIIDGTYELCGPKVQGNPEGFVVHFLVPHALADEVFCPTDYDGLKTFFSPGSYGHYLEGVVWHHQDGRMAKIKGRDFGIKRYSAPILDKEAPMHADWNIGEKIRQTLEIFMTGMRHTGKTMLLVERYCEEDIVVFSTSAMGRHAEHIARDHGKILRWVSVNPTSSLSAINSALAGKRYQHIFFDHEWIIEYYFSRLSCAERELEKLFAMHDRTERLNQGATDV